MQVLKFGGTSVGSVERMQQVRTIIDTQEPKIVVLSAMSGTTNALVQISDATSLGELTTASELAGTLQERYDEVLERLFTDAAILAEVRGYVDGIFSSIESRIHTTNFTQATADEFVSKGELLSTYIFTQYLQQENVDAVLLPALDFMRIDKDNEPDSFYIRQNINSVMDRVGPAQVYITQGFICRDFKGKISNLQRGGSDYTATIIGAAVTANEVQIWTDIDGFHNNDPRFVQETHAIPELSYDEAAELAYFGAKILHPQTVQPLREGNIPLHLKNTMDTAAKGSVITNKAKGQGVKAIAAKDGITALKIKSGRMLQAHGFLNSVFEIFQRYETSIDMITTSEIAVSLTIDNAKNIKEIQDELAQFAQVTIDDDQTIICLVGHKVNEDENTHHLFQILKDVNVRMISYGGSNNNISLLVATEDKKKALALLQGYVFSQEVLV